MGAVFYMPVWGGLRDGLMVANAQYNRTYIETALAEETGKRLTAKKISWPRNQGI